jgi:hypothetical protein
MLSAIPALAFDDPAAKTYGDIVASAGYSRWKLLDRMIAAHAMVTRATLVTFNQNARAFGVTRVPIDRPGANDRYKKDRHVSLVLARVVVSSMSLKISWVIAASKRATRVWRQIKTARSLTSS